MSRPSRMDVEQFDLRRLLDMVKTEVKSEVNCHAIGSIVAFDPVTTTASVAFNYKKVLRKRNALNDKEYTDVVIDYPVLVRCPIVILGGGGAYTTYPISQGDECLVLFCDRDIKIWMEFGITQAPPNSQRMHDFSDAVALVGVRSLKTKVANYSTTSVKTVFGRVVMEFTNLVASIIDRHGERLVPVGTGPLPHFSPIPPPGWLFMYGQTLGRAGSGAVESSDDYGDLFDILKSVYPNSGGSFSNGDKIIIPDCRGRVAVFMNNIGGSESGVLTPTFTPNRSVIGGLVGEESHKLTIAELARHRHGISMRNSNGFGSVIQSSDSQNQSNNYPTDYEGQDQPHNNVQPGIMVNAMIKY